MTEEYSTLKPATNSASASGKSNGALFVSASIVIKNITESGNKGIKNQHESDCAKIISNKLSDPDNNIIGIVQSNIDIS